MIQPLNICSNNIAKVINFVNQKRQTYDYLKKSSRYSGFAGSGHFNQLGGGVNYQCLPLVPEHSNRVAGGFTGSSLYGAEYQSYDFGVFPNSALDQNVPCARCYTDDRPAVMMIPAIRNCPDGWTEEYTGKDGYLLNFLRKRLPTVQC